MPHLTIPQETFNRLAAKAAALNISIDEFVKPTLDQLADNEASAPAVPLTGEAWHDELIAWKRDAESRMSRYPQGFVLDDSRESVYRERESAQL